MTTSATRRSLFLIPLAAFAVTVAKRRPGAGCPKPPRMELRVGRRRQRGRLGTYCWGDEKAGCCVDMGGPLFPDSPLYLYLGEAPHLHFADLGRVARLTYEIWSSRIVVTDDGFSWTDQTSPEPVRRERLVRPTSPIRLPDDLPHGLYLVDVFVEPARGGDTSQGFRLYVGPESRTAMPAATPLATPVSGATS